MLKGILVYRTSIRKRVDASEFSDGASARRPSHSWESSSSPRNRATKNNGCFTCRFHSVLDGTSCLKRIADRQRLFCAFAFTSQHLVRAKPIAFSYHQAETLNRTSDMAMVLKSNVEHTATCPIKSAKCSCHAVVAEVLSFSLVSHLFCITVVHESKVRVGLFKPNNFLSLSLSPFLPPALLVIPVAGNALRISCSLVG